MRLIIYTLILLLCTFQLSAQDWSLLVPNEKVYFTSKSGYLRGMRIDSVHVAFDRKIYFPYKTARSNFYWGLYQPASKSGSWWGNEITEVDNGLSFIINDLGDSVFIRRDAQLNDEWLMFSDTTTYKYYAKVVEVDTQTVRGMLDSIKVVKISMLDSTNTPVNMVINGLEYIISKQNGLIKAIDFYLFPYRHGNYWSQENGFFDNYFLKSNSFKEDIVNVDTTLEFKLIDFQNPRLIDIFNFEVGDSFNYVSYRNSQESNSTRYDLMGLVEKTENDTSIAYHFLGTHKYTGIGMNGPYESITPLDQNYVYGKDEFLISPDLMPEEWPGGKIWYYKPVDTSFCMVSPLYVCVQDYILNGNVPGWFEGSLYDRAYKLGIGTVRNHSGGKLEHGITTYGLYAARRNNNYCNSGNLQFSSIKNLNDEVSKLIKIYPNPVADYFTIDLSQLNYSNDLVFVSLFNLQGKLMLEGKFRTSEVKMKVTSLTNGVYLLKLVSDKFNVVQKITIAH